METILCPVCETENEADATHCVVCGERLAPAQPGEELAPEENVAAMMAAEQSEAPDDGGAVAMADAGEGGEEVASEEFASEEFAMPEGDFEGGPATAEHELPEEEFEGGPATAEHEAPFEETDGVHADESSQDLEPAYLYSPLDGTAYPKGSPEYEEGFGPMGEELVAQPPADAGGEFEAGPDTSEEHLADYEPADAGSAGFEDEYESGGFEDEYAESGGFEDEHAPADTGRRQPSEQFQAAFQVRQKERARLEPLPQPGVHAVPATLTVYVNRQPVITHAVDTDETLIGRKDPRADAYPEIDLTEFDAEAVVSRKHAYVFRQNKNYTLYVVSNAGTQLNNELLELGDRRPLSDGDVIVLAGKIAVKFDLPTT